MASLEEPIQESTSSQGRWPCARNFHYSHRRNKASSLKETANRQDENDSSTAGLPTLPPIKVPPLPAQRQITPLSKHLRLRKSKTPAVWSTLRDRYHLL